MGRPKLKPDVVYPSSLAEGRVTAAEVSEMDTDYERRELVTEVPNWDCNGESLSSSRVCHKDKRSPGWKLRRWRFCKRLPVDWVSVRRCFEGKDETTPAQDMRWVSENLLFPSVEAKECPSASALSLWQWAKSNPKEFFALRVRMSKDIEADMKRAPRVRGEVLGGGSVFGEESR